MSCTLLVANKRKRLSSSLLLYNRESDWMSIQPLEVPDRERSTFFPRNFLVRWGGGGVVGSKNKLGIFFGGGGRIGEFGRGVLLREKFPDLRSPDVGISATGIITKNLYSLAIQKTCSIPDIYEYPVPKRNTIQE